VSDVNVDSFVGRSVDFVAQALTQAGVRYRVVVPGGVYTQDGRRDRVTLRADSRNGTVQEAFWG
jgi:hypothetical protein